MEQKLDNKNSKKYIRYAVIILICLIASYIIYNIVTINKTYYKSEKELSIPIFVYHDIVSDKSEIEFDYMQTTEKKYKDQILGLKALGYHFISYEDLIAYDKGEKPLAKNSCIITFDDGWSGVYKYAYPISKEYNLPITSFIVNDLVGKEGYFNWEQAKEMQESGLVEIASHSKDHTEFDKKTTEEAVKNVNESYKEINEKVKAKQKIFTYPYGLYTEEQREALKKEGYIENLTDNKINGSKKLDLHGLHRCYPLNDSVPKIILKKVYRKIRYSLKAKNSSEKSLEFLLNICECK